MWKVSVLLFFAALSHVKPQELRCTFFVTAFDEYACRLTGVTTLDRTQNRTFTGEHISNLTNADVESFQVYNSNTPFMIQEAFTVFPNLYEIIYINTTLQRIEIPSSARLVYLTLEFNNISRISTGDIQNQTDLFVIDIYRSNVVEIEDGAFLGMPNVILAAFIGNNIQRINQNTLRPLHQVFYLDFEGNNLTRLDEGLITNNFDLSQLYLERNQINEVSPRFASNLPPSLDYINLDSNRCVSRDFIFGHQEELLSLNNGLQACFRNFNGTSTDLRRITIEFQGSLTLFDPFGNLIFST